MMEIDPVEAKVIKLNEAVAVPVKSEDMSPPDVSGFVSREPAVLFDRIPPANTGKAN